MPIYIYRVQGGKERGIAKQAFEKASVAGGHNKAVSAALTSEKYKGYLFVEGQSLPHINSLMSSIRGVRGHAIQQKPIEMDELKELLVPKPAVEGLNVGDLVEITNGPFKKSQGKITRLDINNQEITAELVGSAISLPIKIHADFVRKIGG